MEIQVKDAAALVVALSLLTAGILWTINEFKEPATGTAADPLMQTTAILVLVAGTFMLVKFAAKRVDLKRGAIA